MNVAFAASSALQLMGLALLYWIHTRHYLDIVVDPADPARLAR